MKYLGVILLTAGIYLYFIRQAPLSEVKEVVAASEAAPLTAGPREATPMPSNSLKRPLDRTKEVLGQVQRRNGAGEF